jgi:hypothetical protein
MWLNCDHEIGRCAGGIAYSSLQEPLGGSNSLMGSALARQGCEDIEEEYRAATAADGLRRLPLFIAVWCDGGQASKNRSVSPTVVALMNLSKSALTGTHSKVLCWAMVHVAFSQLSS